MTAMNSLSCTQNAALLISNSCASLRTIEPSFRVEIFLQLLEFLFITIEPRQNPDECGSFSHDIRRRTLL